MKYVILSTKTNSRFYIEENTEFAKELISACKDSTLFSVKEFKPDEDTKQLGKIWLEEVKK